VFVKLNLLSVYVLAEDRQINTQPVTKFPTAAICIL